MRKVLLIHWNADEAKERAKWVQRAGHAVAHEVPSAPGFFRDLRKDPPMAVIIDLGRLPSQGRDVALALRMHGATRDVPLVFVEGDPEKVARIKGILPDAVYTSWKSIGPSLKQAMARPPGKPVVPRSIMEGYAGRPLAKKLGIKANSVVALVGAPQGFRKTLGDLPGGVKLRRQPGGACDLTIWFTRSLKDLKGGLKRMASSVGRGSLWIAWPKKGSSLAADLSQKCVRETGLAAGLVDYKICSIDATWSGLLFTRRKPKAGKNRAR